MISTSQAKKTIIRSLPSNSELEIYAPKICPPKIISQKSDESYTLKRVIKSMNLKHVSSIDTRESNSLIYSFFQKVRIFSLYAQERNGKQHIAGSRRSNVQAKKLKVKYNNVSFLTIQ